MNTASVSDIKKELSSLPPKELAALCLRIIKYKKENKELLSYLLFESTNEPAYIAGVKEEIDVLFAEIMPSNAYTAKKVIMKAVKLTRKYIKYSGQKETEVELLLYFLQSMHDSSFRFRRHTVMVNLYDRLIQKLEKTLEALHPDLQFDYQLELNKLLD